MLAVVGNKWGGSYSKQARAQWLTIGKRRCGLVRANSLFSLSICCHSRQRLAAYKANIRRGDSYQIFDHGAPAQILGQPQLTNSVGGFPAHIACCCTQKELIIIP